MIFAIDPHIAQIERGEKTNTRRPVGDSYGLLGGMIRKPVAGYDYQAVYTPVAKVGGGFRLKWIVGGVYAICPGRGKHRVGFIKVTGIRCEYMSDISAEDIAREGYPGMSIAAFMEMFRTLHKKPMGWNPMVWSVSFEYVGKMEPDQRKVRVVLGHDARHEKRNFKDGTRRYRMVCKTCGAKGEWKFKLKEARADCFAHRKEEGIEDGNE